MLSLSRHLSEKVCITVPPSDQPTRIEVMVVSLNSNKAKPSPRGTSGRGARIGFEADKDAVKIHRKQVQARIDRGEPQGK